MASPIDTNPSLVGLVEGVNTSSSPALNIPNDDQNYHWFLSENAGSRTLISAENGAVDGITANMGVDSMANRILSHVGA